MITLVLLLVMCAAVALIVFMPHLDEPRNEERPDRDEADSGDRPGQADVRLAALTALPAGTTPPGR